MRCVGGGAGGAGGGDRAPGVGGGRVPAAARANTHNQKRPGRRPARAATRSAPQRRHGINLGVHVPRASRGGEGRAGLAGATSLTGECLVCWGGGWGRAAPPGAPRHRARLAARQPRLLGVGRGGVAADWRVGARVGHPGVAFGAPRGGAKC